jgi:NTP pyrophosphatase (non-canonical NTP hydrolase)
MTPNEYIDQSAKTANNEDLTHAMLGLVTEAAEVADAIKKEYAYGKPVDIVNIKEELGDLMWYVAMALRVTGSSFEEIFQMNINKLRARYPGGFTEEKALNRDINLEREILEQA